MEYFSAGKAKYGGAAKSRRVSHISTDSVPGLRIGAEVLELVQRSQNLCTSLRIGAYISEFVHRSHLSRHYWLIGVGDLFILASRRMPLFQLGHKN